MLKPWPRHWIFDLDGTLTLAVHDFDTLRARLGLAPGTPILEGIQGASPDRQRAMMAVVHAWELEALEESTLAPGVPGLLERLRDDGADLGIVTRNSHALALETLRRVGLDALFPPAVVVGRDNAEPKPDPAGVQLLLDGWGAAARDAVMVGNHRIDLDAGLRAGCRAVLVDREGHGKWRDVATVTVARLDALTGGADEAEAAPPLSRS